MKISLRNLLATMLLVTIAARADAEDIIEVTDSTFNHEVVEASNKQPVIVFFRAAWCGPCRKILPEVTEFARKEKCKLVAIDIDQNLATAQKFGVSAIPVTLGYRNSQLTTSLQGAIPKEKLGQLLQEK